MSDGEADRARCGAPAVATLMLWSAHPSLSPMLEGEDLALVIRGAGWKVLPRAGHMPAIEDEPSFDAALPDSLGATSPGVRGSPRLAGTAGCSPGS